MDADAFSAHVNDRFAVLEEAQRGWSRVLEPDDAVRSKAIVDAKTLLRAVRAAGLAVDPTIGAIKEAGGVSLEWSHAVVSVFEDRVECFCDGDDDAEKRFEMPIDMPRIKEFVLLSEKGTRDSMTAAIEAGNQ